jgi:hypothetical protein
MHFGVGLLRLCVSKIVHFALTIGHFEDITSGLRDLGT